MGYKSEVQNKNIAWFLPRPKPDKYKGGMPLYAESWLLELAGDILGIKSPKVLNLFCGMNIQGTRVDLNPEVEPDHLYDVHKITDIIHEQFDVILADPPYSNDEAKELYNDLKLPPLSYKKWTLEATELLVPGGLLIVYHKYVMPNPDPEIYYVEKRVFIGNRTYHVPRVAIFFGKYIFEFID